MQNSLLQRVPKNQRYRASDLTLVMAAIILWNTAYLSRAIQRLKAHSVSVDGG